MHSYGHKALMSKQSFKIQIQYHSDQTLDYLGVFSKNWKVDKNDCRKTSWS